VLLGYHIPKVSGVALPLDLISRLRAAFPDQFLGLKDSSGDPQFGAELCARFGAEALILTGNDKLLSQNLASGGAGCITAAANLLSPDLRAVWDAHLSGSTDLLAQARLDTSRSLLEHHQPFPPTLKALISRWYDFPEWAVRPPLNPSPQVDISTLVAELAEAGAAG
jgi:4-hydroxy-tetrahydrodipicolinate synthase